MQNIHNTDDNDIDDDEEDDEDFDEEDNYAEFYDSPLEHYDAILLYEKLIIAS